MDEGLVAALQRPEAYPFTVGVVGFRQTHISQLFFAGERVYKVKKPVALGFLDFTSLERRRHFCEEEVRLNRRLAPAVYRGVVPVVLTPEGRVKVGAEGRVLDWAVEMVRLPSARMLDQLLDRGEIDNDQMTALASRLAEFHGRAPTGPGVDEHGAPGAVAANVLENFAETARFTAPRGAPAAGAAGLSGAHTVSACVHAFLEAKARAFLDGNACLMETRVRDARIRDGHGDLHAGNICYLEGGIVIYDCIEFSNRLRCCDAACDLAFLAMDLDQRGFAGFGRFLVHRYGELAGDAQVGELLAFYKTYRAVVRAKVASLHSADPALTAKARVSAASEAMRHWHLAAGYELPPAVVLMCGLPGTGKTWISRQLARPVEAVILRSDVRRKILSGLAPRERAAAAYGAGIYTLERRELTYRSLLDKALKAWSRGRSVVIDASFSERKWRDAFRTALARCGAEVYVVHVTAPEALVLERLVRRDSGALSGSDAGVEVYRAARAEFEAPADPEDAPLLELESGSTGREECVARLLELRMRARGR